MYGSITFRFGDTSGTASLISQSANFELVAWVGCIGPSLSRHCSFLSKLLLLFRTLFYPPFLFAACKLQNAPRLSCRSGTSSGINVCLDFSHSAKFPLRLSAGVEGKEKRWLMCPPWRGEACRWMAAMCALWSGGREDVLVRGLLCWGAETDTGVAAGEVRLLMRGLLRLASRSARAGVGAVGCCRWVFWVVGLGSWALKD